MTEDLPTHLAAATKAAIDKVFSLLPREAFSRLVAMRSLHSSFTQRLARELEAELNAHLRMTNARSLDKRQQVVAWVDHIITDLGVCIVVDDQPARLIAELREPCDAATAVYSIIVSRDGQDVRAMTSSEMPHLFIKAFPLYPYSAANHRSAKWTVNNSPPITRER